MDYKSKKIIVATHYLIYSSPQALVDYLVDKKIASLIFINHPLVVDDKQDRFSYYDQYRDGRHVSTISSTKFTPHFILRTFKEFILTIKWVVKTRQHYDLYVGVDNFNAFVGLFLRFLGLTKKVVYYTIDYFPTRFENKLLNKIYHSIDKYCVKHCDETWNISSQMVMAREKHNKMVSDRYKKRQFTLPIGVWFDKAPRKDFTKINRNKLVFIGHLVEMMGVDLAIESLPQIIKNNPDVSLHIIGGGEEYEQKLRRLVSDLNLSKYVKFHGWVKDRKKVELLLSDGSIGIATFNTNIIKDDKVRNADPAKIKDYMLLGMPVIMTDANYCAQDIASVKAGIIVEYNTDSFAKAVEYLLREDKLKLYRQNALNYVKQFDYNYLFDKSLSRILRNED